MKIEATIPSTCVKLSVEVEDNDLNLEQVIELLQFLLIGMGYREDAIMKYISTEFNYDSFIR